MRLAADEAAERPNEVTAERSYLNAGLHRTHLCLMLGGMGCLRRWDGARVGRRFDGGARLEGDLNGKMFDVDVDTLDGAFQRRVVARRRNVCLLKYINFYDEIVGPRCVAVATDTDAGRV